MDTLYMSILLVVEIDTPCMFILQVIEKGPKRPYTSIQLAVERG
jgi:hypothetical protein